MPPELLLKNVTEKVIGVFYDVYNELGVGFPEFVTRRAMAIALTEAGLKAREEQNLPVWFRRNRIVTFRADIVLEEGVLIEVKTAQKIENFHIAQVKHYLRATELEVGLLLNFGRRPEFQRVVFENSLKRAVAIQPEAGTASNPQPPQSESQR